MIRLMAVTMLLAACAAPSPTPSPTPSPQFVTAPPGPPCAAVGLVIGCTTGPEPPATMPPLGTELAPGAYRAPLEIDVTFAVDAAWTYEQSALGFFDVQQYVGTPDVIAVQFADYGQVASADEIASSIEAREHLSVSDRKSVSIGCREGVRLVVETTDPATSDPPITRRVIDLQAGPLSINSGRRLQINIIPFDIGVLIVMIGGSIQEWDQALAASKPVIESLVVAPNSEPPVNC